MQSRAEDTSSRGVFPFTPSEYRTCAAPITHYLLALIKNSDTISRVSPTEPEEEEARARICRSGVIPRALQAGRYTRDTRETSLKGEREERARAFLPARLGSVRLGCGLPPRVSTSSLIRRDARRERKEHAMTTMRRGRERRRAASIHAPRRQPHSDSTRSDCARARRGRPAKASYESQPRAGCQ